jgi:hypothetical protein
MSPDLTRRLNDTTCAGGGNAAHLCYFRTGGLRAGKY